MTYKLKAKRVEKGIKQKDVADKVGISRKMLIDIEAGRVEPRRDLMLKIAEILKEDVTTLFFDKCERYENIG